MARQLHYGEVYQVKRAYGGLYGCDGQDALYDIFSMFEIENDDFIEVLMEMNNVKLHYPNHQSTVRQRKVKMRPNRGRIFTWLNIFFLSQRKRWHGTFKHIDDVLFYLRFLDCT